MKSLQTGVLLVGVLLAQSEALKRRCFTRFDLDSGRCEGELDTVEEDDCCQNPHYGFIDDDEVCQFCGPSVWTAWSPWSQCSNLCGWGVVQRTRKCRGLSECPGDQTALEMKPCESSICCPAAEWKEWGTWTPCSISCGSVQGHRRRERVCSHLTVGCQQTCVGPNNQTESCVETQPCPVHGGWATWDGWTPCTAACIPGPFREDRLGDYPSRRRRRTCSSPAPSQDTRPVGNNCQGHREEDQICSELPNCPVNGSWGKWGPFGACSTSCGEGITLSIRLCDNPAPQYGGQYCIGPSTKSAVCASICPVHGTLTGWSVWGECSGSCHSTIHPSIRTRQRSCSNPAPSSNPNGNNCLGVLRESKKCDELPNCPVDGAWGPWGPYSGCSVTCGVGHRHSVRTCDNPNKGKQCPGSPNRTLTCITNTHCPIDGVWSEWSDWGICTGSPCEDIAGIQKQRRSCLQQDFGGAPCPVHRGHPVAFNIRGCYNIDDCRNLKPAGWSTWSQWSLCSPHPRNQKKISLREKECKADLSGFSPSQAGQIMSFYGKPEYVACVPTLPINQRKEITECINIPPTP